MRLKKHYIHMPTDEQLRQMDRNQLELYSRYMQEEFNICKERLKETLTGLIICILKLNELGLEIPVPCPEWLVEDGDETGLY